MRKKRSNPRRKNSGTQAARALPSHSSTSPMYPLSLLYRSGEFYYYAANCCTAPPTHNAVIASAEELEVNGFCPPPTPPPPPDGSVTISPQNDPFSVFGDHLNEGLGCFVANRRCDRRRGFGVHYGNKGEFDGTRPEPVACPGTSVETIDGYEATPVSFQFDGKQLFDDHVFAIYRIYFNGPLIVAQACPANLLTSPSVPCSPSIIELLQYRKAPNASLPMRPHVGTVRIDRHGELDILILDVTLA